VWDRNSIGFFHQRVGHIFITYFSTFTTVHSFGGRIKQKRGFSLIEIAIVLVIFGFLAVGGVKLLAATVKNKQYIDTRNNIEAVNAALVQFVSREKRLPCPADGTLTNGVNNGVELRTGTTTAICDAAQLNGVVPWRTLGLIEADVTDGWFNRLTYRIAPELVSSDSMNFSECDPAGTLPCISPATCIGVNSALTGKGFTVNNLAAVPVPQTNPSAGTGAAFVLISHGENTAGAYNNNGILVSGSIPPGSAEIANANNRVRQNIYFADNFNASAAPAYFDDLVYYKTVHSVVGQARLDARSH
jgi:prepilin-type N-terminal cleavage/methylation domain-containing protein